MKNKIKRLNQILKTEGYQPGTRAVLKVYLSIVLFHKRIPEVAEFFDLPESKVESALTTCGLRLQKDIGFVLKMRTVTEAILEENQLRIVL